MMSRLPSAACRVIAALFLLAHAIVLCTVAAATADVVWTAGLAAVKLELRSPVVHTASGRDGMIAGESCIADNCHQPLATAPAEPSRMLDVSPAVPRSQGVRLIGIAIELPPEPPR